MSTSQPIRFTETSPVRAPSNETSRPTTDENPMAKRSPDPDIDVKSMTDDELAQLAVEVPREIERRKAELEAEFFATLREQASALNIPASRLKAMLFGKAATKPHARTKDDDGRKNVRPKYRHQTGATWSGRGKQPAWVAEHLAAGGTLEQLRIPDDHEDEDKE
jgi:DNA-binding protein H-NS